ncbi:MAG: rhodanese-like domain-containing protein [Bacteroidales bacterium]|jgi:rhodanese-related sulfurtransferase|nr:rhodanese-like domain-containing protein [Bacteroidales bacterium]
MKIRSAVILLLINLLSAKGQVADTAKYISLDPYYFHLQYLKEDTAILIDVRLPFEYRGKIIRDAINIPSSREMKKLTDTITKNHALFLYCTTDDRSRRAAELLYDQGFRKLYNLEGGIVAWRKEKMPVVKGRRGEKEKRRRREA